MLAKRLVDYSVYLFVRSLICGIQAMPVANCHGLSRRLAWLMWHTLKIRRKVVRENLCIAFPEKSLSQRDAIALAMWEHLLLMMMEIAHAPRKIHRTNWRTYLSIDAMEVMIQRLIDDRPLVIISGHLGNFELGGYLLAMHGFATHTVARPLDNPYLDRFVNEFRSSKGQYILPKQGSGGQIISILERGGTLVLLGDQYAGDSGCWVDFFGRPASTHKSVAVFSLRGRTPTVVSATLRAGKPMSYHTKVADIVDPQEEDFALGSIPLMTEWYTRCLEELIRTAPEQYWWVHRRWKGQPTDRRNRRRRQRAQAA